MLMVGHLLEYHPGVAKLKEIADSGELGDIHYIYSNRLNLGQAARGRERALEPRRARRLGAAAPASARSRSRCSRAASRYMRAGVEDVVFCYLRFPSGPGRAHAPVVARPAQGAPLHGRRARKRMATFDDMELERKVTVYDKGFDERRPQLRRVHHALGRHHEPADLERGAAADRVPSTSSSACATGASRAPTAPAALRVVRVLEALQRSLDGDGAGAAGAAARRVTAAPGLADARPRRRARRGRRARRQRRHPRRHRDRRRLRGPGRCGARQAPAPRRALDGAARRPDPLVLGRRRTCAPARSSTRARGSGAARSSATRRRCASAPRSAPSSVIGRGAGVENDVAIGARVRIQTQLLPDRRTRWSRTTCSSAPAW